MYNKWKGRCVLRKMGCWEVDRVFGEACKALGSLLVGKRVGLERLYSPKRLTFVGMRITSSVFVKSVVHAKEAPKGKPQFAMIGRSNVGKSSLINALLHRKNLARTSGMPGKTQLINYFLVNEAWFLVDLPGYGWAQRSKQQRAGWEKMVKSYLAQASLETVFLLLDSRHPLQAIDMTFIAWLVQAKLPYAVVLTKADKCTQRAINTHLQQLEKAFHARRWPLPPFFVTSAHKPDGRGVADLLAYVQRFLGA